MNKDSKEFLKFLAAGISVIGIAVLIMNLGFKTIDHHFPSKFDKLVHCNK